MSRIRVLMHLDARQALQLRDSATIPFVVLRNMDVIPGDTVACTQNTSQSAILVEFSRGSLRGSQESAQTSSRQDHPGLMAGSRYVYGAKQTTLFAFSKWP